MLTRYKAYRYVFTPGTFRAMLTPYIAQAYIQFGSYAHSNSSGIEQKKLV